MTLLVFSRGSYGSAIWFQGEDGGQDTLRMTGMFQWRVCFCSINNTKAATGTALLYRDICSLEKTMQ